jgi:hypothetical protein
VVQTLRPSPARLAATGAALALAGGLVALPLAYAGSLAATAATLGLLGLVLIAVALAGFPAFVPWALMLLGLEFAVVDLARDVPLEAAPFEGAGLLLAAELTYAARELARGPEERPARRAVWLLAVGAGALAVAFVPVVATTVSSPSGFAAELVAVFAAVALLTAPALLARRGP